MTDLHFEACGHWRALRNQPRTYKSGSRYSPAFAGLADTASDEGSKPYQPP